jgi:P4 family phage/plasmid primase-like protien
MARKVNITELKALARGRWVEIFAAIAGVQLDPSCQKRHGPCPKCGGTDRFRATDLDNGALFCNACFSSKNGDGIAALGWLTGRPFKKVVDTLCEYLGAKPTHKVGGKAEKPKIFGTPQGVVRYFLDALAKQHGNGVRLAKTWQYDTFHVLRFDLPTPIGEKQRKEFRPVHQVPLGLDGGRGWQAGYPAGPRPLYLRKELEGVPTELVTIHGGEKAADAAAALSLVATTNAGGEKAMDHTDWSPILRFATIAIVADNDPAGEAFGSIMAAKLRRLKSGADVRIIKLPNLPPKGDIVEWVAAGGTRAKFLEIVAATPTAVPVELDAEEYDDDPHRLAKVFLDEHCPYERIVFWRGEYWSWDTYYRPLYDQDLRADVTKAIKAEFDRINVEKQLRALAKAKGGQKEEEEEAAKVHKVTTRLVGDVLQAVKSMVKLPGHIDQQTWIDGTRRPSCVSVENCLLDLDAFIEQRDDWNLPHTPNWFSPIFLPYPVDVTCKNCQSPKWDKFLDRVLEGDKEGIATLQEWSGYCLTHDTSLQRFLLLEGEGNNGKSVFCAALVALLGRQNVSHVPLERFGGRFDLSTTLGKLANIATECSELDKAAEGVLKSFTSGDRMLFEEKMKQSFSAMPTARFILSANNRPRFSDRSGALWRRMMIVKFNVTIPAEERIIGMDNPAWWDRSGELPGIFWWAVLGLHRLRQQGHFTESEKSVAAVAEYREETNPARAFPLECCEAGLGKTATVFCSTLYDAYCRWCKSHGYHSLGEATFGKEVIRVFPNAIKKRFGGHGSRQYGYSGVCLVEENALDAPDAQPTF